MTKLEQLTKAIQSAVPDIMKLEMGCKLRVVEKLDTCSHYYDAMVLTECSMDTVRVYGCSLQDENSGKFEQVVEKKNIYKILGRPITLEDCLIAGFKSLPKMNLGNPKNAEIYKKYEKFVTDITLQESQWKPNKPLHQQEQETLTFLADLLL